MNATKFLYFDFAFHAPGGVSWFVSLLNFVFRGPVYCVIVHCLMCTLLTWMRRAVPERPLMSRYTNGSQEDLHSWPCSGKVPLSAPPVPTTVVHLLVPIVHILPSPPTVHTTVVHLLYIPTVIPSPSTAHTGWSTYLRYSTGY